MSALVVETVRQRLARLLPGAELVVDLAAHVTARHVVEGWRAVGGKWERARLGTGSTEREAADRAISLHGRQR
jgi:hypothetical protein